MTDNAALASPSHTQEKHLPSIFMPLLPELSADRGGGHRRSLLKLLRRLPAGPWLASGLLVMLPLPSNSGVLGGTVEGACSALLLGPNTGKRCLLAEGTSGSCSAAAALEEEGSGKGGRWRLPRPGQRAPSAAGELGGPPSLVSFAHIWTRLPAPRNFPSCLPPPRPSPGAGEEGRGLGQRRRRRRLPGTSMSPRRALPRPLLLCLCLSLCLAAAAARGAVQAGELGLAPRPSPARSPGPRRGAM